METKNWFILVGIVIFTFGAGAVSAYQYYLSVKSEQEAKKEAEDLRGEQARIIREQQSHIALTEKTNEKASEIITANSKIMEAQIEATKKMMGNGYPRVVINGSSLDELKFKLLNESEYSIYDINVMCLDYKKLKMHAARVDGNNVYFKNEDWESCILHISQSDFTLPPDNLVHMLPNFKLKKQDEFLTFKIATRNMRTMHYIYVRYDGNNGYYLSGRVYQAPAKFKPQVLITEYEEEGGKTYPDAFWNDNFFIDKLLKPDY